MPAGSSPSSTVERLRELRAEMTAMVTEIALAAPPGAPLRFDEHRDGEPLRIWHHDSTLRVHTIAGERGCVWISAQEHMQWKHDWTALGADEARAIGLALLAAAADSENDLTHRKAKSA